MNRGRIRKLERLKLALMIRGREKMDEKRWYKEGKENENLKGKMALKMRGREKNW